MRCLGPRVVIFAKAPRLGTVKTRLAASLGDVQTLAFYQSVLSQTADRLRLGPWQLVIAVTPDQAVNDAELWPADIHRIPQGQGDLGARMGRLLALATTESPLVIVGSDIPDLDQPHVERALASLRTADLVLGPASDGGYWLIGAACPPSRLLFDDVRWSTEHARADTVRNAGTARVVIVDQLDDVDTAQDYDRYRSTSR
jgi:uncharacterized protein